MLSNTIITRLKKKKITVLGLGREGLATFKFLRKNKIRADILDVKFDKKYADKLKNYDVIFRTPGFPRLHPKLLAAEKKGAIISSHVKLFLDLCPGKIIGITGTKGKTTTASLIFEILKSKFGKKVFLAGNVGRPALDILPKLRKNSLIVLELSSFQLQDLHKSPNVAVITNLTLDHLDPSGKFGPATHQTAKEYRNAKLNIVKHQRPSDFAILNPALKKITSKTGRSQKIYFDTSMYQRILRFKSLRGRPRSRTFGSLRGKHNLENAAAAIEVGKIFKVPKEKMLQAVRDFKGIEHRLEFVAKINGVSFYNDSAATNPDATLAALKSFKEPLHLILGGSDKGLDYKKLTAYISKSKNIKTVALIGQLKNKLYKFLKPKPGLEIKKFKSLKDAVLTIYKNADKNEVVLLSPAAASLDMFSSYAERGDEFKKLVKG